MAAFSSPWLQQALDRVARSLARSTVCVWKSPFAWSWPSSFRGGLSRRCCERGGTSHQPATSHQPPATSHQPPATSHQPPATSHQPPATSHQPPATSHQPPATSHQPPATSHQPPATSHQPPATSHQPPATSHHSRSRDRSKPRAGLRCKAYRPARLGWQRHRPWLRLSSLLATVPR